MSEGKENGMDGAEAIFIANYATATQATAEAQGRVSLARATVVACGDCGAGYNAGELDGSTGLCAVCYDAAGEYNLYQDYRITEAELAERQVALGYAGGDRVAA